ncbi:MAG: DUF2892 domain-containing protein [Chloroflexaceae bacterium]|jgi:hypothetical protein|nr:DUF2892 domain-containing protein [Chloroflexaceae bacterium]
MFSHNEGTLDRDIRLVLGILFGIVAIFFVTGIPQLVASILAIVLFATAAVGFCPLYYLMGLSTCPIQDR